MLELGSGLMGILLAYLIGSISTAILVSRLLGLPDPRHSGSGNPGATNVLRLGGKLPAALTLLGDILKGWLPVLVFLQLDYLPSAMIALIGLAAFLGHLYPLYFEFKGGKGVATAVGVVLAISPITALLLIATWLITAAAFRYSSLAALVAALAAPIYLSLVAPDPWLVAMLCIMVFFLYLRHLENIKRLLSGTESRIGK